MTAQTPHPELQCPACGTPPLEPRHLAFGYCGTCRGFTHLTAVTLDKRFVVPLRMGGGAMRCCTEPMVYWAVVNPAPWEPGTVMPCLYQGTDNLHGHICGDDGFWHSLLAAKEEEKVETLSAALSAGLGLAAALAKIRG